MGLKKSLKKGFGKFVGNAVRTALGFVSGGASEVLGVGKASKDLTQSLIDPLTGEAQQKKEKEAQFAVQQAAQKAAQDQEYYDQIMSARDKQISSYLGSRTNYTESDDAIGNYGSQTLGGYNGQTLGRYKKKNYY